MKKTVLTAAALASAAALLAACGSTPAESAAPAEQTSSAAESAAESTVEEATAEAGNAEYADITPESIRTANTIDALMTAYDKVSIHEEYADENGETVYTNDEVIVNGEKGIEVYQTSDLDGHYTLTTYKETDANGFAGYIDVDGGDSILILVKPEEKSEVLNYYGLPPVYGEETVAEVGEQDGIVMVVTDNVLDGKTEGMTTYCLNPETLRPVAIVQSYNSEDGSVSGTLRYTFAYGSDVTTEVADAMPAVLTDDNPCALTVVFHPGEATETTETFNISRNAEVGNFGDEPLCTDADLTKTDYDLNCDALTLYTK